MKVEISWINWVKVISIALVYLYHTSVYSGYNDVFLFNFYSPFFTNAFFFISGYLLFRKQLSAPYVHQNKRYWLSGGGGKLLLANVVYKIIFPSILFSTINYFPKMLLREEGLEWWSFFRDTLLGGSLWFTSALAVSEILLGITLICRNKSIWLYVFFSFLIAIIGVSIAKLGFVIHGDSNLPWYYKSGMIATLYLSCGGLFWKYEDKLDYLLRGFKWVIVPIVYCILLYFFQEDAVIIVNRGSLNLSGFALSIVGVLTLVYLCKRLKEIKLVSWLGRHTLGLYFFSGAVPSVLSLAYIKIFGPMSGVAPYSLLALLSLTIGCFAVYVADKYVPFVFDLRLLKHTL